MHMCITFGLLSDQWATRLVQGHGGQGRQGGQCPTLPPGGQKAQNLVP